MTGWDDPNIQHKGAVQQILDAREKASTAVSEARQYSLSTTDPHLAAVNGGKDAALAIGCSQAVVDYLLELRPYRHQSTNWNVDFGDIELPKSVKMRKSAQQRGESPTRTLWLCRQPQVPLTGLSRLIEVVNMTVVYSSNRSKVGASINSGDTLTIDSEQYGTLVVEDRRVWNEVLRGTKTVEEAANHPSVRPQKTTPDEKQSYTPAKPPGAGGYAKKYKVVLPDDQLLRLYEAAEQIAGDVDMLAEIEPPDHSSSGSEAI